MSRSASDPLLRGGHVYPRQGRRIAADQDPEVSLPEFNLCVGGDSRSSGATAWLWLPTGGQWPSYKLLGAYRWASRVQSAEEAVVIAYRLIQSVAKEQGYSLQ